MNDDIALVQGPKVVCFKQRHGKIELVRTCRGKEDLQAYT